MAIEIREVSKTFGQIPVLRNVSLEAKSGELLALLGPSGCGKTTLLRIIAGLEIADNGAIFIHGEEVTQRMARERRVGFVFQHYALFRQMTVFENVAFGLRVRPRRQRPAEEEIRRRVAELLRLIQIEFLAERYPHQLSGGQRQRVALARALAAEPRVLLLDEPFGALDAQVRQELRRWLRRLHDEIGLTSIFVTHDQEEALEVADRIAIINAGQVEQIGTPEEVFHHPSSEMVMRFLGRVNLFPGRLTAAGAPALGISQDAGALGMHLLSRPHELEIIAAPDGGLCAPATIARIQTAGSQVKITLHGEGRDRIEVEMPHEKFARAALAIGARVFIKLRHYRLFAAPPPAAPAKPELRLHGAASLPERLEAPVMLALSTFRRSQAAVDLALEMAQRSGSLIIVWVADINLARYLLGGEGVAHDLAVISEEEMLARHERENREQAEKVAKAAQARGVRVETMLRRGRFAVICREALAAFRPALVVTTRSQRPEWMRRFFGSPVEELIRCATCPVAEI